MRQIIDLSGTREKLRQLLVEKTRQGFNDEEINAARQMENWFVMTRRSELAEDLAVAKRRMAVEKTTTATRRSLKNSIDCKPISTMQTVNLNYGGRFRLRLAQARPKSMPR